MELLDFLYEDVSVSVVGTGENYKQIGLDITSGSLDECSGRSSVNRGDHLITNVVSQHITGKD